MTDARLERLLQETAGEVAYPETPDLAFSVTRRLTRDSLAPAPRARSRWLRPAAAVAAISIGLGFLLTFSPAARRAAADLLGIVGIRISVDGGPGGPERPTSSEVPLSLGRPMSFAAAVARADFPLAAPSEPPVTGSRAGVYFDPSIGDAGMASLVYPHDADTYSDVDILISQFRASLDQGFFKKVSEPLGEVTFTDVGGVPAYWLSGEPHLFYYVGSDGEVRQESVRLAGNVLLWERDGIAHRLEGAATLSRALEIAEGLR